MSEAVAYSPANAEEEAARAAFTHYFAVYHTSLRSKDHRNMLTFSSCCGSLVLDEKGTCFYTSSARVAPRESSDSLMTLFKTIFSKYSYESEQGYHNRLIEYIKTMTLLNNAPGIVMGLGISLDALKEACWEGSRKETALGIEFNDPDDGLVTFAWTTE